MSATEPLLRAHNAEQLVAAAALAGGQHGRGLALMAKALADSAHASVRSPGDLDAAARLADAAALFTKVSAENARLLQALNAQQLSAAAAGGQHGRALAQFLRVELRDTALSATAKVFADTAREFSATPWDLKAAEKLADASHDLAEAAAGTPQAGTVSDLLRAAHVILSFYHSGGRGCLEALCCFGDEKPAEEDEGRTPALLGDQARRFADSAAGTSMAEFAVAFSRAVEDFGSGKGKKKEISFCKLTNAAKNLAAVAARAPESESELAAIAVNLTEDSHAAWISEYTHTGVRCGGWASCVGRFQAAISGPELTLPIYHTRAERQVISNCICSGSIF